MTGEVRRVRRKPGKLKVVRLESVIPEMETGDPSKVAVEMQRLGTLRDYDSGLIFTNLAQLVRASDGWLLQQQILVREMSTKEVLTQTYRERFRGDEETVKAEWEKVRKADLDSGLWLYEHVRGEPPQAG